MVLKWRVATHAIILGSQRRWNRETAHTHRNPSELGQFYLTDTAFVGEKKRKEAIRNLAEDGREDDRET